jgi:hypothetical protein
MSKTAHFGGASDDCIHFGIEEDKGIDEIYGEKATFTIVSKEGLMKVRVEFDDEGKWTCTPKVWDEDTDWPNWKITHVPRGVNGDMTLEVEVPDDAKVLRSL